MGPRFKVASYLQALAIGSEAERKGNFDRRRHNPLASKFVTYLGKDVSTLHSRIPIRVHGHRENCFVAFHWGVSDRSEGRVPNSKARLRVCVFVKQEIRR